MSKPISTATVSAAEKESAQSPPPQIGQLALVPFGGRQLVGVILEIHDAPSLDPQKIKDVLAIRTQLAPLDAQWRSLAEFAANYYQRPLGEVMLPSLPRALRTAKTLALTKALDKISAAEISAIETFAAEHSHESPHRLNSAQQTAVEQITQTPHYQAFLLHGITGSGKTEVYLQTAARLLRKNVDEKNAPTPQAQILILVPEINLTPQLQAVFAERFGAHAIAVLHSGLAEGARLANWLRAHLGQAQIILGTRLAILSSLPFLKLIVVDEEHDPSYKQQEGLRYSARDLAVWRARQLDIPVVLGSATPSLETWYAATRKRYQILSLTTRAIEHAVLPTIQLIDTAHAQSGVSQGLSSAGGGISAPLLAALRSRLEHGEQSLLFLNRRGYAPVISCEACNWMSQCLHCTAFMVWHKNDRVLRCHHCSYTVALPRSCPTCGNVDLQPVGRGTQRIEEYVQGHFPTARIQRIDADSTRRKGSAQVAFAAVHAQDVDILVGTQMVSKGHDFQHLTLVGVLNSDSALFNVDYRAGERLFAQLMQVAGRAGRYRQQEAKHPAEVLIQTRFPRHPLYAAIIEHDYPRFANQLLIERQQAGLPPFTYQALLRAEAKEMPDALEFLKQAAALKRPIQHSQYQPIVMHAPIPMAIARVANVERAQLLVECASRALLQIFLKEWMHALREVRTPVRWSLEVDPLEI